MKVDVYRNLRNGLWSVRSCETKRVIAHASHVLLTGCDLIVNQKGRQAVLDSGHKNVHAYVRGTPIAIIGTKTPMHKEVSEPLPFDSPLWTLNHTDTRITYDPYKYGTFVNKDTEDPVSHASVVWMAAEGVVWAGQEQLNLPVKY